LAKLSVVNSTDGLGGCGGMMWRSSVILSNTGMAWRIGKMLWVSTGN
jgi:hypothetical protein